ncbi:hypothetical protein N825_12020 [Skermanella stibiiresistens SB22]|uniref:Lipoprotein n=1 Tax=Skermanella stibiiresistens SB22 TaxID=1385369 RepID=W9GX94_9PROT|nr:hypothetical protein [Skermanella stibiiresistens]EWY38530.1 hypothetical protein N825_12020 [Skermanella stibiiresistens SB22]
MPPLDKLMTIAAVLVLAACAQSPDPSRSGASQSAGQGVGVSRGNEPPSRFQSVGACEPTEWAGLQEDAKRLPPDQRGRVDMMFDQAQSYYAENNRGQCILVLQNIERTVRQGGAAS